MKGLSTAITLPARRDRASELFPALAFEPERKLFLLADNSIGFGFLCQPAVSTENLQENLNVLLNLNWPTGTLLQFTLWTSPDIEPFLAAYNNQRFRLPPGEARERVAARARFIREGAREPLEPYTGARVRDIQLLITAKLPLAGVEPTERELGEADDRRNSMEPNLRTAGFGSVPLEPEPYLRFMASLLNWGADAGKTPNSSASAPMLSAMANAHSVPSSIPRDWCIRGSAKGNPIMARPRFSASPMTPATSRFWMLTNR